MQCMVYKSVARMGATTMTNQNVELIRERILESKSLERCPTCFKLPEVTFEFDGDKTRVILRCLAPGHDHVALGYSYEQAIEQWNAYIRFYKNEFLGLKSANLAVQVFE